jgi:predicted transcriptional regulator
MQVVLDSERGCAVMRGRAGYPGLDAAGRRAAGKLEAAVLAVLQAAGSPLSPGEVGDRLGGGLAYSTVVTILSRLHGKGVLDRRKAGRAFLYRPAADEPGLAARRMARVLDAEPDRQAVLARFVSGLLGPPPSRGCSCWPGPCWWSPCPGCPPWKPPATCTGCSFPRAAAGTS